MVKEKLASEDRCIVLGKGGRCVNAKWKGADVCSHHQSDIRRGCSASKAAWKKAGREALNAVALKSLPKRMCALSIPSSHLVRLQRLLEGPLFHCTLALAESSRGSPSCNALFVPPAGLGDEENGEFLHSMTLYAPLARVLLQSPMVVSQSTFDFSVIVQTFTKCCEEAVDSGTTIKIIGSASLRDRLLKESLFPEGCAASGNKSVFWLTSLYENLFLCGQVSESVAVKATIPQVPNQQVCKAVHKIEEAFEKRGWVPSSQWRAIDIGAAPGSWAAWLADKMIESRTAMEAEIRTETDGKDFNTDIRYNSISDGGDYKNGTSRINSTGVVVAIDPSELAEEVLARPNVRHIRTCAPTFSSCSSLSSSSSSPSLEQIQAALCNQKADCVVCDMNRPPEDCISILAVLTAKGMLQSGCRLVLTLKLSAGVSKSTDELRGRDSCQKGAVDLLCRHWNEKSDRCNVRRGVEGGAIENAKAEVGGEGDRKGRWRDVQVDWLFSNTMNESTITAVWDAGR